MILLFWVNFLLKLLLRGFTYCNGDFIGLAVVVLTLDLTVVLVGRVAGFSNYNTEYIHYSWSEQVPHVRTLLLAMLVTKRVKIILRFSSI